VSAEGLANGIAVLVYIACIAGSMLLACYRSLVLGLLALLGSLVAFMSLLGWASSL
jgi:hypothetical protein